MLQQRARLRDVQSRDVSREGLERQSAELAAAESAQGITFLSNARINAKAIVHSDVLRLRTRDPLREGGRFHRWQRLSVLHQKPEALGIDRQAEVRALRLFAATAFQEVELLTRLNAIGGDAQAEPTAYTE